MEEEHANTLNPLSSDFSFANAVLYLYELGPEGTLMTSPYIGRICKFDSHDPRVKLDPVRELFRVTNGSKH